MTRLQLAVIDAALFVLVAALLLGATVGSDEAPPLPPPPQPAR